MTETRLPDNQVNGLVKDAEEKVPLNPEQAETVEAKKRISWAVILRYVSLVVLVVQNTSQVLLMRYAMTRNETKFLKTVAVFFNEVLKFIAATILFFITTRSFKKSLQALKHHFITDFFDTIKVGVPAFIYTIQNFLLYVAVNHLDAATYMVTYQLKILTTALFTVLMLKRRLSIVQWLSLCVLIAGVALVQLNAANTDSASNTAGKNISGTTTEKSKIDNENAQKPLWGLIAVLIACILSGFAGIYFEKILKASDVSIWLRNIQLSALSMPISLIMCMLNDYKKVQKDGFMQGFDLIVWGVVAIQALGGLVVAVVIKYADNILKAFATSVSIILASIATILILSVLPEPLFVVGATLVIAAVVLYSVFPYRAPSVPKEDEEKQQKSDIENGLSSDVKV